MSTGVTAPFTPAIVSVAVERSTDRGGFQAAEAALVFVWIEGCGASKNAAVGAATRHSLNNLYIIFCCGCNERGIMTEICTILSKIPVRVDVSTEILLLQTNFSSFPK